MPTKFRKNGSARVCLYCSERHFRMTHGEKINDRFVISIPRLNRTNAQMEVLIKNAKDNQKRKNQEFRRITRSEKLARLKILMAPQEKKDTDAPETKEDKELAEVILGPPNVNAALNKIKIEKGLNLRLTPNSGNSCAILGSSQQGKTTILMWIYRKYYKKKSFITTLFSVNSQISAYKGEKNLLKCNTFDRKAQKYIKMEKFINNRTNNKYNFANLIDDVLNVRHNALINNLILTYRNSKISTCICMQYSNLLSKATRANFTNVIMFRFLSDESTEVIIKTFLRSSFNKMGIFGMDDQIKFYKKMTKNHQFLYYHPASDSLSFHKISIRKKKK